MGQGGEGRLDHVVRIGGADRFRDHVLHAERLEDGAHRTAGDDAGARLGRPQNDDASAEVADDIVMQRPTFAQRNTHQRAARLLGRFADRFRHFARLARTVADAALAVADDDECGETETPAALHHLGDAVDADQFLDEFAFARAFVAVAAARAAFARRTIAVAFTTRRTTGCARSRRAASGA